MKPKVTVSQLRAEADRLIATGQMPDLTTVLAAVSFVREKHQPELIEAQRQSRIHVVGTGAEK